MVIYHNITGTARSQVASATRLLSAMESATQPHGVVLKKGQSLFDGALQHCGEADQAQAIALLNGWALDHVAEADEEMLVPAAEARQARVLKEGGCEPCTGELAGASEYTFYGLGHRRLGRLEVPATRITREWIQSRLRELRRG